MAGLVCRNPVGVGVRWTPTRLGQQQRGAVLDERQMAYVVGRIEMKRLRRSLETDEFYFSIAAPPRAS